MKKVLKISSGQSGQPGGFREKQTQKDWMQGLLGTSPSELSGGMLPNQGATGIQESGNNPHDIQ